MIAVAGCAPDGSTALAPVSDRVQRAVDLGRLAADTQLDFVVGLSLRDPAGMRQFLGDRARVDGPLRPDQFVERYAPDADAYQRVVGWLRGNNLLITRLADGRTTVSVQGAARDVEHAFGVELHQYRDGSDLFAAAAAPLRLPPDLVGHINGVVGLSGSRGWHTHYQMARPLAGGNALTAADLTKMYNTTGITNPGMGETVAILGAGFGPDPDTDVGHYVKNAFGASFTVQYDQVQVGGANRDPINAAQNEEVENALDAEMVLAMAPNAHVVHVLVATNTPGLFFDGISYIVNQLPMAHAVTVSYGSCERGSATEMPAMNTLFQQAQAMGQQWFFSSGDSGTDTCGDGAGNKHVAVDWPASSPYVVGVGGTMINNGTESAWNANSAQGPAAGGGGPSEMFVKPAYQMGVSPADGARDLPDVAAIAGAPGVNVLTFNTTIPLQGTSVSSPLWAGMWALVDQAKGGAGITDALTKIYAAGKSTGFNDITTGDNGGPDDKSPGYPAGTGYDLATGWGTPNVANLITSIQ